MTKIEKAIMKEILLKLEKEPKRESSWSNASGRGNQSSSLDEKSVKEATQMLKDTLVDPQSVYNSLGIVEQK